MTDFAFTLLKIKMNFKERGWKKIPQGISEREEPLSIEITDSSMNFIFKMVRSSSQYTTALKSIKARPQR